MASFENAAFDPWSQKGAGDLAAQPSFEEIYKQHAAFVWRVLLRFGVPKSELDDVCQEVFVVVHRKLSGFAGRSSHKTWISSIAYRCAAQYRRRAHIKREVFAAEVEPSIAAPQLTALAQAEARVVLEHILNTLEHKQRVVFVLFELEEMPMKDIAKITKTPLQTAYSRLQSARRQVMDAVARLQARERNNS